MDPIVRCQVDPKISRKVIDGMSFPLGVYPVEKMTPRAGYTLEFESADTEGARLDDETEWDQWPDRYMYDIVAPAEKIRPLCVALLNRLPGRVFPILDYIGHDAFREIDPFIAYEMIGLDRFMAAVRRYGPFLFEDGMCGFGAMTESPFTYVFLDEHKVLTVRVEPDLKPTVDRVLAAFDLEQVEEPAGADAAAHEHRGVLETPDERPDLLSADEVVEWLREEWRLTLNVDPEINVDEGGRELGFTPFRCLVRWPTPGGYRYGEALVVAHCLAEAEELAFTAAEELAGELESPGEPAVIAADRMTAARFGEMTGAKNPDAVMVQPEASVVRTRLLTP